MLRDLDSAPDMEASQDEDCRLSDSGRLKKVVLSTDYTVGRLGNVGES
jgi:hypothetical protein